MKSGKESLFSLHRIITANISVAGFGIMAYLTKIHYESASGYFCDISGEISCSEVAQSAYSEILGIPVAILGVVYFAFVFLLVTLRRNRELFQFIFLLTLFVLIPSLYLSLVEIFEIKVICVLCEASKVLMVAIVVISFVILKQNKVDIFRKSVLTTIAGVLAAVITYLVQIN